LQSCPSAVLPLIPIIAAAVHFGENTLVMEGQDLGKLLPLWSALPFGLMLLSIAILPLVAPHFWEKNRNKALISALFGVPVALYLATWVSPELASFAQNCLNIGVPVCVNGAGVEVIMSTALEYLSFILLLGALFTISGGIVIRGSFPGTPEVNTIFLGIGAILASFIGTTGASMLLIRPLLRANAVRQRKAHIVIFFIFLVSNVGGLLTPLGDPPLFLGFLNGVPFEWTLSLLPQWLVVVGTLLVVFYLWDSVVFRSEDIRRPGDLDELVLKHQPFQIVGARNIIFLGGVVLTIYLAGTFHLPHGVHELTLSGAMVFFAMLSWKLSEESWRRENHFSWGPIIEVAVVFAGVFATMIPALLILNARGPELGLKEPWQFFWATGALSSFLDNAPTYLTMSATAAGLLGVGVDVPHYLHKLIETGAGATFLAAVSCGAVFMGANTYIGNGPNFMVKAIAEHEGIKMPSFFGYMLYSGTILLPIFVLVTWLFFRA
jgi:Na+/H+ antiporter NhaD/arsenite permease-like protein